MTDPSPLDPLRGLPPELAGLDAELSGISIEEQASLGPELEAELRREFADPAPYEARGGRITLLAACIALLLIDGTVPPGTGVASCADRVPAESAARRRRTGAGPRTGSPRSEGRIGALVALPPSGASAE